MGVGHPLPRLQSSVQASSPVALPQVARSPAVVWWLLYGNFVGIWLESLWTRSRFPFAFEVLLALFQGCFIISFLPKGLPVIV
jgi:hypothetical protein